MLLAKGPQDLPKRTNERRRTRHSRHRRCWRPWHCRLFWAWECVLGCVSSLARPSPCRPPVLVLSRTRIKHLLKVVDVDRPLPSTPATASLLLLWLRIRVCQWQRMQEWEQKWEPQWVGQLERERDRRNVRLVLGSLSCLRKAWRV